MRPSSLREQQSDLDAVAAAAELLTGQSPKSWWARLLPFLEPAFIAGGEPVLTLFERD